MAKLIYVPLGCSLRSQLAEKLSQQPLGEGVLVLPNRLLTDDVRSKYANVETMGMDTLAGKLMNLNGGTDYRELSRRSQERAGYHRLYDGEQAAYRYDYAQAAGIFRLAGA